MSAVYELNRYDIVILISVNLSIETILMRPKIFLNKCIILHKDKINFNLLIINIIWCPR